MDFGRRRRKDKYAQFYLYQISPFINQVQNSDQQKENKQMMVSIKSSQAKDIPESQRDLLNSKKKLPILKNEIQNKETINQDKYFQKSKTGEFHSQKQTLQPENTIKDQTPQLSEQSETIMSDEEKNILSKIYPVKRPMMFLYNKYSGMKIDNYKEAQINDICENPFYYHDYRINQSNNSPPNPIADLREKDQKDLRYKICLQQIDESNKNLTNNPYQHQPSRLDYPQGQFISNQDIIPEFQNSLQDLSDIMSEDYNSRPIQEFKKKPINENELISLSEDNKDQMNSPQSFNDYPMSDYRLQSLSYRQENSQN